jgi:hypothetical protein
LLQEVIDRRSYGHKIIARVGANHLSRKRHFAILRRWRTPKQLGGQSPC